MQVGIVKLHARLIATHALYGLAASVGDRASKARIGITLASQKAAGVVVLCAQAQQRNAHGHALLGNFGSGNNCARCAVDTSRVSSHRTVRATTEEKRPENA